jgi:folate-binding Fe-S cluster repair protein YgfZ
MNFSTSPAIFRWKPAAWLRVTGEDAANFLQGQFTNELRGVPAGGAVYGLWLTLKGKVLADSFVVRGGMSAGGSAAGGAEVFWVGSYFSPAAAIRERLEAYVIADDVVIEDLTTEWAGVTVWGGSVEAGAGHVVFPGRRSREACVEWMFPAARANEVWAALAGRVELDAEEMERRRIAAAVPAVPVDIGPRRSAGRRRAGEYRDLLYQGLLPGAGSDGAAESDGPSAAAAGARRGKWSATGGLAGRVV